MSGVKHEVWFEDNKEMWSDGKRVPNPRYGKVCLANNDDGYYLQVFESAEEIDALIEALARARDKANLVRGP